MRRTLGLAVIAPLVTAAIGAGVAPAHAATAPTMAPAQSVSSDALAAADFAWVNQQRAAAGVAPLQVQPWAASTAAAHSVDMANSGTIYHNMTGYMAVGHGAMGATFLGENVAMGTNIDYAQSALINSPPHRQNILDPRFNYLGVGAATDANGQVYLTEDFAQIGGGAAPAPQPVAAASPKPVVTTPAPAPKPVVVHTAAPVAVKPVAATQVAPKPAVAPTPTSVPTSVPATPAASPAKTQAAPAVTMTLTGQTRPTNRSATLLLGIAGVLAAAFALGLGFVITRVLPGR